MISATSSTAGVTAPAARVARRPVWLAGGLAAAAGATVLTGYGLLVQVLPVPMAAGEPGAAAAQPFTAANFAFGTILCTFWGTVLAVVLARRAARPARTFVRTCAVLVAGSLVFPLAASHTAGSTRLALAAGHLLAAAVVVPLIARRLPR